MHDANALKSRMKSAITIAISAWLIGLTTLPVEAGRGGYRWITVQSQEDFRTVTVPVRNGRNGYEVRTPDGLWLECGYTCAFTVQNEYLDFFTCGPGGPEDDCSPGILDSFLARRLY